jgi:ADP-heptose:LPS heptosyltransferase
VGDDNVLLAGLNLAASPRWESKNWPLKHMAEFCAALGRKGVRVVLTGMNKDLATADRLLELAPDAGIINACAKTTVNQLACLIARCAVYVTPDSAPLHIAASQGTPFVALFGPTDPRRHLPPGERWCVIQKADSCGPCYKSKCATRACMEAITPREVLKAVEAFLPAGAGAHA